MSILVDSWMLKGIEAPSSATSIYLSIYLYICAQREHSYHVDHAFCIALVDMSISTRFISCFTIPSATHRAREIAFAPDRTSARSDVPAQALLEAHGAEATVHQAVWQIFELIALMDEETRSDPETGMDR